MLASTRQTGYEYVSNSYTVKPAQPCIGVASFPGRCIWLLKVCKYGGGRPGRFGHVRLRQVDRW